MDQKKLKHPIKKPCAYEHGMQFGKYIEIDGELTDEKLAGAKTELVEALCSLIRDIANDRDDFFIITKTLIGDDATTVAVKIEFPTVKE